LVVFQLPHYDFADLNDFSAFQSNINSDSMEARYILVIIMITIIPLLLLLLIIIIIIIIIIISSRMSSS